jgi:4a-hydroxytetrahydrobiopterin dehydratase
MANKFKAEKFRQAKRLAAIALGSALILVSINEKAISAPQKLNQPQVRQQLQSLPGWATDGKQLTCSYKFGNFVEAIAFVNRLVQPAEAAAHHPDLQISYNLVKISLSTHDAGGLTQIDFDLARQITALSNSSCLAKQENAK